MPDYSLIDLPHILQMVFYPRDEYTPCPKNSFDIAVPMEDGVEVFTRFYMKDLKQPSILYFHGNGEVIYDYDDVAPLYNALGVNLIVADYRGYGSSGGYPTFTDVCKDAKVIFNVVKGELAQREYSGKLWLMGRSLGSLSALEIAFHYQDKIEGLILESGFSNVARLINNFFGLPENFPVQQFDQDCLDMLKSITLPALILHGDMDHIVPYKEGLYIHENLSSTEKKMITISNAGHNDIMYMGMKKKQYFEPIKDFIFR